MGWGRLWLRSSSATQATSPDSLRPATTPHTTGQHPSKRHPVGSKKHRLSLRGNRKLNHAIHMAAVSQIRNDTPGRVYYEKKRDEGKTTKEALRALNRRVSDAIYKQLTAEQISGPGDTQERLIACVAGFAS
jgi:hypothetical protein